MFGKHAYSMTAWIFVTVFCLLCTSAKSYACIVRLDTPNVNKPDQYHTIFIAKVETFSWIPSIFSFSDLTAPYKITISSDISVVYGATPHFRELEMGPGCGFPIPEVGEVGLFFQKSQGSEVVPLRYYQPGSEQLEWAVKRIRRAEQKIK